MIMKKKPVSTATLLVGVVAFLIFLVAACAAYYVTTGVFVSAQIAGIYAILGALGALALLFRMKLFPLFFYVGCVLGWLSGRFVGGLDGDFAPTAGLICTFGLILFFSLVGTLLEWKAFQRRRRKDRERLERQQKEDTAREQALLAQQTAKAEAKQDLSAPVAAAAPTLTLSADQPLEEAPAE